VVFYDNAFHNHKEGFWIGVAVSMIAMITWAMTTIFIAKKKSELNPYNALGWQMLLSSFIMYGIANATGDIIPFAKIPLETWATLAYMVGAGSIIAFIAFIYSMKNLEPGIAALYAYINPIVAILVGSLLVDEKLTINILIGSAITLIGCVLGKQKFENSHPTRNGLGLCCIFAQPVFVQLPPFQPFRLLRDKVIVKNGHHFSAILHHCIG